MYVSTESASGAWYWKPIVVPPKTRQTAMPPDRGLLGEDLKQILDVYYPEAADVTRAQFNASCHLSKNLRCAEGYGAGSVFCQKNEDNKCVLRRNHRKAQRLAAMRDQTRRKHEVWRREKLS